MHDPKVASFGPRSMTAARYQMDATPGRHTAKFGPVSFFDMHIVNSTGLCHFGRWPENSELMMSMFNAITGWNSSCLIFSKRVKESPISDIVQFTRGDQRVKMAYPPKNSGQPTF